MAGTTTLQFGADTTMLGTNSSKVGGNVSMDETSTISAAEYVRSTTWDPQVHLVFTIRFWWYSIVIPVGIIGNLLCLLVLLKKQNRKMSCNVYMAALAMADTMVLVSQSGMTVLMNWLPTVFPLDKLNIMCKVFSYSLFSSAYSGTMIILALLVDRVIAVTNPLRAAGILSPKRAMFVTITLIMLAFAYHIPFIFSATMMDHFGLQCICVPGLGYASVMYHRSKIILSGVLPLVAILTMNLTILCAFKSSQRQQKHLSAQRCQSTIKTVSNFSEDSDQMSKGMSKVDPKTATAGHQDRKTSKAERQLTIMTVVLTLSFLCLTMPKYAHHLAWMNIDWQSDQQMVVTFGTSSITTQELYILNSAVNFFLYAMTGSKFRRDFIGMFKCKTADTM